MNSFWKSLVETLVETPLVLLAVLLTILSSLGGWLLPRTLHRVFPQMFPQMFPQVFHRWVLGRKLKREYGVDPADLVQGFEFGGGHQVFLLKPKSQRSEP